MLLGPFNLILSLLTTVVSLAILGGGIYFVWGWYDGVLGGIAYLIGGIALIAYSFLGRWIMVALLGRRRAPDARPEITQAVSHWIDRPNGSRLYVEQLGTSAGPTVILTHGLSLDATSWKYIVPQLAQTCRLFVWDLPGFGRSSGPTRSAYTMEMLAGDLEAVVELAGDGPVILAGHSLGGMTTLTYCRLYSEQLGTRVSGLILAQTTFTNPTRTALFARLLTALQEPVLRPLCWLIIALSPLLRIMNVQSFLSGMAHVTTHLTGFADQESGEQLDFAARYNVASSPASSARALLATFGYDATDILPEIRVPTLIITGDRDIVTLPEAGEILHRSLPVSQRITLKPSGHLGLIEHAGDYVEAISQWAISVTAPAIQAGNRRTA
jgi:pimeloyl-ACP methyl ester carboxylesterase